MKKINKIYALIDPRNNKCRYIGKTCKKLKTRLNEHIRETKKLKTHKHFWINSILKENKIPIILEIDVLSENDDWAFWEMYWIEQFKSWGFSLTNGTSGGEGLHNPTDLTRKNISLSKIGDKNPNFGKKASDETRLKMSECRIGENNANFENFWSEEKKNSLGQKRVGNKNPFFGKKHKKESILKTSKSILVIEKNGNTIEYISCRRASDEIGISRKKIREIIDKDIWYKELKFKYVNIG